MNQILIIDKPHSFVDVITNSSTTLFVSDIGKSVDTVRDLLHDKWIKFIELYPNKYDYENDDGTRYVQANRQNPEEVFSVDEAKQNYTCEYYGYSYKKGDILIRGVDDNSIPSEFFDVIHNTLGYGCKQIHLG